jgi:hypothetical protein
MRSRVRHSLEARWLVPLMRKFNCNRNNESVRRGLAPSLGSVVSHNNRWESARRVFERRCSHLQQWRCRPRLKPRRRRR